MNWRMKAAFFWGFKLLPWGSELHYLAQRRLTHSLPRRLEPLADHAASYMIHNRQLGELFPDYPQGHLLEFGAGRDLFGNLLMWCCGVERQTVIDISPLLKPELINHVITTLRDHPLDEFVRTPKLTLSDRHYLAELRDGYGISYLAPADARAVAMAENSIDLVCTTNTLEHIPGPDIARILAECYRLCRPGAMLSMVIDYGDHFSHNDASITPYNFLRFDERTWRRYNPPDQHQNRLRHRDHRRMFEQAGFTLVRDESSSPDDAAAALARVPLDPRFAAYPRAELLPIQGRFVAIKND